MCINVVPQQRAVKSGSSTLPTCSQLLNTCSLVKFIFETLVKGIPPKSIPENNIKITSLKDGTIGPLKFVSLRKLPLFDMY